MTRPRDDDGLSVLPAARPTGIDPSVPVGRTRRGTELAMLGFALVVILVGYTAVGLAEDGLIPEGLLTYGAALGGLFLLAHLAVR